MSFDKVTKLFQDINKAVVIANRLDKAYADAAGKPDWHKPFGLSDNPQMVAMNLAGLYAADTLANILAVNIFAMGGPTTRYSDYIKYLHVIAEGTSGFDKFVAKNIANLAWRTCQPFRDITTNPLNRITRDVNAQFNTLPSDEQDKDLIQVITAARILLEELGEIDVQPAAATVDTPDTTNTEVSTHAANATICQ